MKFQFVFGFILLILFLIGIFVGLPYVLGIMKSQPLSFFSISKISIPKVTPLFLPGYFYSQPKASTFPPIGKVKIGNIYRYGNGQINLRASYFEGVINITGWRIKSAQRGETIIGKGINLPQFESALSDVWLSGGQSVEIIVGISPLANNFRVNSCFGGLSGLYNLGYAFNYCPGIEHGDLTGLDSSCQDLILRSSSCSAPSDDVLNKQSSQCRVWFEKNVNYNVCVLKHQSDRDFYREWKIYTGNNNQIFDLLHDRIELRDENGFLVDQYEY